MDQIKRIKKMEEYLDISEKAIEEFSLSFEKYEAAQKALKELSDYYGSSEWMRDYEDDEAGRLPDDLKRGVLSEDAVYNMLTKNHEIIVRMMKVITGALDGKVVM